MINLHFALSLLTFCTVILGVARAETNELPESTLVKPRNRQGHFPLPPNFSSEPWTQNHPMDGFSLLHPAIESGATKTQANHERPVVELAHPVNHAPFILAAPDSKTGSLPDAASKEEQFSVHQTSGQIPSTQVATPRIEQPPSIQHQSQLSNEEYDRTVYPQERARQPVHSTYTPALTQTDEREFRRIAALSATTKFGYSPSMIGDFFTDPKLFSGDVSYLNVHSLLPGTVISGTPGTATATLAFDIGANGSNDLFTTGIGSDLSGDGNTDAFSVQEPLVTSDAVVPHAGFRFVAANARLGGLTPIDGIYADGDPWDVFYVYRALLSGQLATVVPVRGPALSSGRTKVSQNYSPDVRNRFYFNYDSIGNIAGGLGNVERGTLGVEQVLFKNRVSLEARLPFASQYASQQSIGTVEERDTELGNITLILKSILKRRHNLLWAVGLGLNTPTADDTKLELGGQELLVVKNETYHLLPFTSLLYLINESTSIQAQFQGDFALGGDPVHENFLGAATGLNEIGEFEDSDILHLSVAASRSLWRRPGALFRQAILNAELHYSSTIDSTDVVTSGNIKYASTSSEFRVLNTTLGMHFLIGDHLALTPAVALPITSDADDNFDYHAMMQVNYLR